MVERLLKIEDTEKPMEIVIAGCYLCFSNSSSASPISLAI